MPARVKSYDGGKNGSGVYQTIINQIPPHRRYFELFLGHGAILRHKLPALVSIGIDADPRTVETMVSAVGHVPNCFIQVGDAFTVLERGNFLPSDFIYLDPPYLMETRSWKGKLYRHELSENDHIRLLRAAGTVKCMVAISGYDSDLYNTTLDGWRRIAYTTVKRNGRRSTEVLWMNYPEPAELHDYRYLGRNYRERERIKLKIRRHVSSMLKLPDLERNAILEAIARAGTVIPVVPTSSTTVDHTDVSGDTGDRDGAREPSGVAVRSTETN